MNSKRKNQLLFFSSVLIVSIIMCGLNFLTPLIADDLEYFYKTEAFSTIFKNEYHQYMTWTGRSVVHVIARVFLLLPKPVFNLANAFAYTFLTILIYWIASAKRETEADFPFKYILINAVVWLFIPSFGQVFLWETGAANYLWGSVIILTFLSFYHMHYLGKSWLKHPRRAMLLMFIGGILAGWCNENTSGGAVLLALMYMILIKLQHRSIPKWMISGLLGAVIGLALMVGAPGNAIRAAHFVRNSWSIPKKLFRGILQITEALNEHALLFFIILGIVIGLNYLIKKNNQQLILSLGYTLVGLATLYVLSLSPSGQNWGRPFYGGMIYLIIALFISWPNALVKQELASKMLYLSLSFLLLIQFAFAFVIGTGDIVLSYQEMTRRYDYLKTQKAAGNLTPVFGNMEIANKTDYPAYSNALAHMTEDPKASVNQATAKYYGLTSVTAVSQSDWERIYYHGDPALMKLNDLTAYLKALVDNERYVVILSGLGDLSVLRATDQALFAQLFPEINFANAQAFTLSAIRNQSTHLIAQLPNASQVSTTLQGKEITVSSQYTDENTFASTILINQENTGKNLKGLNFVILDAAQARILDAVHFPLTKTNSVAKR